MPSRRRVGLLRGGGDCPGLNAVIRAAARTAFPLGGEVGGVEDGFDGRLGTRFAAAAMRLVAEGRFGTMVALDPRRVEAVPLARAVGHGRIKKVPLESDILQSARDMGIGFGD